MFHRVFAGRRRGAFLESAGSGAAHPGEGPGAVHQWHLGGSQGAGTEGPWGNRLGVTFVWVIFVVCMGFSWDYGIFVGFLWDFCFGDLLTFVVYITILDYP